MIEISPSGLGLHFSKLDADLYVPALLEGILGSRHWIAARLAKKGGSVRSAAKAGAARANGRQGAGSGLPQPVPRRPPPPRDRLPGDVGRVLLLLGVAWRRSGKTLVIPNRPRRPSQPACRPISGPQHGPPRDGKRVVPMKDRVCQYPTGIANSARPAGSEWKSAMCPSTPSRSHELHAQLLAAGLPMEAGARWQTMRAGWDVCGLLATNLG